MKTLKLIFCASIMLAIFSCERDPIVDQESNYTFCIHCHDYSKKNISIGSRLWWYDPAFRQTGWSVIQSFSDTNIVIKSASSKIVTVGSDELFTMQLEQFKFYAFYDNGTKVFDEPRIYSIRQSYLMAEPGKYYLLGISPGYYNFITVSDYKSSTLVTYDDKLDLISFETDVVSKDPQLIIKAPSQMYVGRNLDYNIPYVKKGEGYFNMDTYLTSPVESWRIIVHEIKNLNYASTINFILTNQYKEVYLKDLHCNGNAAIMFNGECSNDMQDINTIFGTFGMVPDVKYILQATIVDYAGFTYKQSFDITKLVAEHINTDKTIEFDWDITLQKLVQGGLKPTTNEWDQEYEQQTLQ